MEKNLRIIGMHCKSCEMLLIDVISEIKGVEKVNADSKKGTVTLIYNDIPGDEPVLESVKKIIEKEGYKVI